jgi:hypothetical protein
VNMQCERELSLFRMCAPIDRFVSPFKKSFIVIR